MKFQKLFANQVNEVGEK